MKLLLIFYIIGTLYCDVSGDYQKSNECAFGPSYWCHSIRHAKECNAVTHCIQTVWEKQVLPEDNDDVCHICLDMVKQARDTLKSNETQLLIKQVFEGSCNLIPIKEIAKECSELADGFIPELVETLSSEMNPQVVCATAGLCNSVIVDKLLRKYGLDKKSIGATECSDCHVFLKDVSEAVKSHPRSEVENHLLAICGQLSSLSTGCRMLVKIDFNNIYNYLAYNINPDEVCNIFGLCGAVIRSTKEKKDDLPCEFCVDVVQHWREELASKTTEEQFREILDGICSKTGKYENECRNIVGQYYEPLYNLLVSEIHPKQICESVGICGVNSIFHKEVPIWTTFAIDDSLTEKDDINSGWHFIKNSELKKNKISNIDSNSYKKGKFVGDDEANSYKKGKFVGDDETNSYKKGKFVGDAEANYYKKGKFVGDDEAKSYKKSKFVGDDESKSYKKGKFVGDDESKSYKKGKFVGDDESNSYIRENNVESIPWAKISVSNHGSKGLLKKSDSCVMCEFTLHYLQDLLQDRHTREEIIKEVDQLCLKLPHSVGEECEDYVDAYGDELIELIIQGIDPSRICSMLHLCPGKAPAVKEDTSCVLCEFVMVKVDELLGQNKTQQNIEAVLEKICFILPADIKQDCKQFVDDYTEQIIDLLTHQVSPAQACVQLGLCKQTASTVQLPLQRLFWPSLSADLTIGSQNEENSVDDAEQSRQCVLCEFVMSKLKDLLKDRNTEEEIQKELSKVCALLPTSIMHDCVGFVEEYSQTIVQMLAGEISPEQVCEEIGLCKNNFVKNMPKATIKFKFDRCYACEEIVDIVDHRVRDDNIPSEAHNILINVCPIFEAQEIQYCEELVQKYGPYIVKLMDELHTPRRVCQAMKECSLDGNPAPILGSKHCTYGPDYWCQSKLHASACGATHHCETKVWGVKIPIPTA